MIAEGTRIDVPSERTPARGLAKLLRRNPTDAERILWDALIRDGRFAGLSFHRHPTIGQVTAGLLPYTLRTVIEVIPANETEAAIQSRANKRRWLADHDYTVLQAGEADILASVTNVLDTLSQTMPALK